MSSGEIRTLAESSRQRFVEHADTAGEAEQVKIIALASRQSVDAAAIKERDSEWASAVEWAAYATVAVVLLALVWKFGIARFVRRLYGGA